MRKAAFAALGLLCFSYAYLYFIKLGGFTMPTFGIFYRGWNEYFGWFVGGIGGLTGFRRVPGSAGLCAARLRFALHMASKIGHPGRLVSDVWQRGGSWAIQSGPLNP
jgi:hypothetical protein